MKNEMLPTLILSTLLSTPPPKSVNGVRTAALATTARVPSKRLADVSHGFV